jgi:hypothetical protein
MTNWMSWVKENGTLWYWDTHLWSPPCHTGPGSEGLDPAWTGTNCVGEREINMLLELCSGMCVAPGEWARRNCSQQTAIHLVWTGAGGYIHTHTHTHTHLLPPSATQSCSVDFLTLKAKDPFQMAPCSLYCALQRKYGAIWDMDQ